MNFNAVYNAVLSKVAKEAAEIKSKKGFAILESKIMNNPALIKQYIVFSTLKDSKRGLTEDEAQNQILFVERYCSKLSYADLDKANREFAKYFNIDPKSIETNSLDESIDDLVRFNTGGTVLLSEGTKYRKTLLDYLTTKEESKEIVTESATNTTPDYLKLDVVTEALVTDISERYNKLNKNERFILEAVRSNNINKLDAKLQIVEAMAKRLSSKEQSDMLSSSVKELKDKLKTESIETVAYKMFDLRKAAIKLMEGQYGAGHSEKLKDLNHVKGIQFGCFDDRDRPETVILRFTINTYPLAATYMDYNRAAKDLDKRLSRISRNVTNQTIFQSTGMAKQFFTGEGIWDSSVRSEGLRPGQAAPGHVEWWLYTVQDPNQPKSIEAFKPAAYEILQKLDSIIPKWIPEVDPKAQQDYLAMLKEPVEKHTADDEDEDEVNDTWYDKDQDDETSDSEPSAKDLRGIEKQFGIGGDEEDEDED